MPPNRHISLAAQPDHAQTENSTEDTAPLLKHLQTLRKALFRSLLALVIGFCIAYPFAGTIFDYLHLPLKQGAGELPFELIYTSPFEVFIGFLKIGLLGGLVLASPYWIWEAWRFLAPALYKKERRTMAPLILASVLLFVGGVLFSYLFIVPTAYGFFLGYAPQTISPYLKLSEYLAATSRLLLAFGFVFQMPLLIIGLCAARLLRAKQVAHQWRIVVTAICVVSAILTPADVVTMTLMAVPLLALFFISLAIAFALEKARKD